jgi:hypothetical protein
VSGLELDPGLGCSGVTSDNGSGIFRDREGGRRDKSTDVGRGACGWFDRRISSAACGARLSLIRQSAVNSMVRATAPGVGRGGQRA